MKYLMMIALMALVGCASSDKVKQLDTEIDVKGYTRNGVIGLQDDVAVIQEKRPADDELRIQQWKNFQLENDLNHEYHMANWCYDDLSDPRLGGNGEVSQAPEVTNMKNSVKIKEELGLEGEKLMVVKTSSFKEQLAVERQYEQSLVSMTKAVKKTRGDCERKMAVARLKVGLPAKRYQGQIKVSPEGTVEDVIKPHENNLDKAFEIKNVNNPEISSSEREPASSSESKQVTEDTSSDSQSKVISETDDMKIENSIKE